jgi:carbamoyltransferase
MRPTLAFYGIPDRFDHAFPAYVHDHNLCVMQGGRITHYLHLERLTRRKYDNRLPELMEDLLESELADVLTQEPDLVSVDSFVGRAFISRGGRLRVESLEALPFPALRSASAWWQAEAWRGRSCTAYSLSHELAHVASVLPFAPPPDENALFVHFDGGASLGNFSAFRWQNGQFLPLECHWELAHYSKIFNDNALSFRILGAAPGDHCSVPGKFMGYATLQEPEPELMAWLNENELFATSWDDARPFFDQARERFGWQGEAFDTRDPFLQQVAASLQEIFITGWERKLTALCEQYRPTAVYLTGGCALNIVANSRLVALPGLPPLYIPPCCNDAGLAIGAACLLELRKGHRIAPASPYLNSIGTDLPPNPPLEEAAIQRTAELLAAGAVVGVCNGWGEAGPRALGNRSLLARADDPELARHVSQTCKRREWYRPIAPVLRAPQAQRLLRIDRPNYLSRYMLLEFRVRSEGGAELAGVTHANGSVRAQILNTEAENPFLWQLLQRLETQFGLSALINTSFNGPGEPIVHTSADARRAASTLGLDALIINGKLEFERLERSALESHERTF